MELGDQLVACHMQPCGGQRNWSSGYQFSYSVTASEKSKGKTTWKGLWITVSECYT